MLVAGPAFHAPSVLRNRARSVICVGKDLMLLRMIVQTLQFEKKVTGLVISEVLSDCHLLGTSLLSHSGIKVPLNL